MLLVFELAFVPSLDKEDDRFRLAALVLGLQVFELLASVPWLDEDDVKQKELKGMAMVSGGDGW